MLDFIILHIANKYMSVSNGKKRIKLMRLEKADRILNKLFKWCVVISIYFGLSWNIGTFRDGKILLGILDSVIEYIIYPLVIILLSRQIKQGKFDFAILMGVVLAAMMLHTPTYSPVLIWCAAFVVVRFRIGAMQSLSGYPKFQDDLKGKKADVALTEEQRYAAFINDVKQSNKILWHDEPEQHKSEEILSGEVDIDGYFGVHKSENPGVMDELIIPDDLLEDSNAAEDN